MHFLLNWLRPKKSITKQSPLNIYKGALGFNSILGPSSRFLQIRTSFNCIVISCNLLAFFGKKNEMLICFKRRGNTEFTHITLS